MKLLIRAVEPQLSSLIIGLHVEVPFCWDVFFDDQNYIQAAVPSIPSFKVALDLLHGRDFLGMEGWVQIMGIRQDQVNLVKKHNCVGGKEEEGGN